MAEDLAESQLLDSLLGIYWQQKMAKKYFVVGKPDTIDKLVICNIEEDKIED